MSGVANRYHPDRLDRSLAETAMEALEDADDIAIFDERMAALEAGTDAPLTPEVSAYVMKGDSLMRALRRGAGLTQAQLAERTNFAQSHIEDLETRRATATGEDLRKLAEALGVDPAWLGVTPAAG